jgi:hypothetical protein
MLLLLLLLLHSLPCASGTVSVWQTPSAVYPCHLLLAAVLMLQLLSSHWRALLLLLLVVVVVVVLVLRVLRTSLSCLVQLQGKAWLCLKTNLPGEVWQDACGGRVAVQGCLSWLVVGCRVVWSWMGFVTHSTVM